MATVSTTEGAEVRAKQQEKDNLEREAAVTGAQAVADAVSKFAQEAAQKVQAAPSALTPGDFVVTGAPGGRFELRAKSTPIFSSSGTVYVGGKPQVTYEWGATYIRGKFDADVKSGEVVVEIDSQTRRIGYLKV